MLARLSGALVLAASVALAGCASKSYVVLVESPDGSTGAIIVDSGRGGQLVNRKNQGVTMDGANGAPFDVEAARLQADFAAARDAQPALPARYQFYFNTGGTSLTTESANFIPVVLEDVRQRGAAAVSIIGHTDTVGDDASNEKLGLMRARSIASMLQRTGLQALELSIVSHGKRNLLVPTADNVAEPRNRRVEVNIR
ncbi:OmpA family protein [Noviherbaspirillum suwonense]|uniref:Outer membrane protein OmpA n=1 Tax=Noviherbaspirillum suwonense TaxID=1224511 RepID=A0ABY1QMS0_9BURK|nr:OmpA family protein [Noviherbaspirillum suwonense]SMP75747.1 Outer membrane protein OmpA [Noviherbaspirillum suwonense]